MTPIELVFDHAGQGGRPLLLVHGWPETRRIWERNVDPLAEAGFDVIVPDLRGFGDSPLAPDDRYDVAAHSADLAALVKRLGHDRLVVCGGDLGGVIAQQVSGLADEALAGLPVPLIGDALASDASATSGGGYVLLRATLTPPP